MKLRIILFVPLLFLVYKSNGQWRQTGGPTGGGLSNLVNLNNQIFVKSFSSGVFKLSEDNENWENKIIDGKTGVFKLVADQNAIYVSLAESGIYKSNDLGENWFSINSPDTEDKSFNNFIVRNEKIYASNGGQGIYYSLNGGDTWSEVDNDEIKTMKFNDFEIFEDVIYAGGDFLFKSEDKGVNWEKVDIPNLDINGVWSLAATAGNIYVRGGFSQVLISSNGKEWEESSLNTFASITSMSVKGDSVLLSTSQGRIFITSNKGTSWELIQNNETSGFARGVAIRGDEILMLTEEGIYFSIDNGVSWSLKNSGLITTPITSLVSIDGSLFASNNGLGVFKSSDNGDNWEIIDNGLNGLNAKSVKKIISVGDRILIGTGSEAYVTQNKGETWEVSLDPGSGNPTLAIGEDSGKIGIGVNRVGVYVSLDTAKTWTLTETAGLNLQTGYEDILLIGDTIALSTTSGEIFVSVDLGKSWTDISISDGFFLTYSLHYHNEILYAASARGLLKSNDLGKSWDFAVNDSQSIQDIHVDGNIIYAASENGVLMTSTEREQWTSVNEGIEGQFINAIIPFDDGNLYIGTLSRGVWKRPLSEFNLGPVILGQNENIDIIEGSLKMGIQFYPNPVTDNILNVDFNEPTRKFVYDIYSFQGIKVISSNGLTSNSFIDVSSLQSGNYILTLRYNQKVKSYRFQKLN